MQLFFLFLALPLAAAMQPAAAAAQLAIVHAVEVADVVQAERLPADQNLTPTNKISSKRNNK
eukprot:SAG22_NODE_1240_length_5042_cov_103.645964_11_plen_62_part_00